MMQLFSIKLKFYSVENRVLHEGFLNSHSMTRADIAVRKKSD